MSRANLARHAALLVAVGTIATATASSADAQRTTPRPGQAGQAPPPPPPAVPYPGATIIADPRGYGSQPTYGYPPAYPRRHGRRGGEVVYVPVPVYGYPIGSYGGGGGVYDTNGRPLHSGFDTAPQVEQRDHPAHGTPDLSGSPYVVVDGGLMVVDFGNNDRRVVPACAALAAEGTPDGRARTVFYRPPVDGLVLRGGQRGRVIGLPTAGARVCYTADAYGRMVLEY